MKELVNGQWARVIALAALLTLSGCAQVADLMWRIERRAAHKEVSR